MTPVPPLHWCESVPVQGVTFVVLVLGFAGFGLVVLLRRLRGRRGPRAPWSSRVLACAGLAAVVGWPVYLGTLLFFSGGTPTANGVIDAGPLLGGRPLVWLALQALAVVAVLAGVVTATRYRPPAGDRVRAGVLLGTGVFFVVWSAYWGLLLP